MAWRSEKGLEFERTFPMIYVDNKEEKDILLTRAFKE